MSTDTRELLARILLHIPEPRRHVIRYYGAYSNAARARSARETAAAGSAGAVVAPPPPAVLAPTDADARALRRRWAQLIRRIYEADPLVCPRCGEAMRIIAFVTAPRVIDKILKHLAAKGIDARSPPTAHTDVALLLSDALHLRGRASSTQPPGARQCHPTPFDDPFTTLTASSPNVSSTRWKTKISNER